MTTLQLICQQCVERMNFLKLSKKKRDAYSYEFMVGAAVALEQLNHPDAEHLKVFVQFVIGMTGRGFDEIERIATNQDAAA